MQNQYTPQPPVLLAAFSGNLSLVHMLLEKDPSQIEAQDSGGTNLLHLIRDERLFRDIVLCNKNLLKARDSKNQTVMEHAFHHGFSEEFLISIFEQEPSLLYLKDNYGNLPIHTIFEGIRGEKRLFLTLLTWMIKKDSTLLERENQMGYLPIFRAAICENFSLMTWALDHYPHLFLQKHSSGTLPMFLFEWREERTDFLFSLFEKLPELLKEEDPTTGRRPLHCACSGGNQKLVEKILAH